MLFPRKLPGVVVYSAYCVRLSVYVSNTKPFDVPKGPRNNPYTTEVGIAIT